VVWGGDQISAGLRTAWSGTPAPTLGGLALEHLTGISPASAELIYGLLGLSPTAMEAYALNRALNAKDTMLISYPRGIRRIFCMGMGLIVAATCGRENLVKHLSLRIGHPKRSRMKWAIL